MTLRDGTELAAVLLKSDEFRQSQRFKDFLKVREDGESAGAEMGAGVMQTAQSENHLGRRLVQAIDSGIHALLPRRSLGQPPGASQLPHNERSGVQILNMAHESRAQLRALLIGNCQASTVGRLMQAMSGDMQATSLEATPALLARIDSGELDLRPMLADADLVFIQLVGTVTELIRTRHPSHAHKLRQFPPLNYAAFHPDCVYIKVKAGGHLHGSMGDYHSSIAFWAWREGWSEAEAVSLYRREAYDMLGFSSFEEPAEKVLLEFGEWAGLSMKPLLQAWNDRGVWMHTVNHPHVSALADLTAALLAREGIEPMIQMGKFVADSLANFPVWPVYPEVGARFGQEGSYLFKVDRGHCPASKPNIALSLQDFVEASFQCYRDSKGRGLQCDRLDSEAYASLEGLRPKNFWPGNALAPAAQPPAAPLNPYSGLPDGRFWRRMMEQTPSADVDPVGRVGWQIAKSDKVATAGSCFAQHISRTLRQQGFHYLVGEAGEALTEEQRQAGQYGVFSGRYGNIYTARQLVQLFDRAYGRFTPLDTAWRRPDGRFVDPFRPQVEPSGYASEAEVDTAREQHLAAVRTLFEQMDVFVFTLGLTEAWQRREDGAVFPLAPGVVAGSYEGDQHRFVNFSVAQVAGDIRAAVSRLRMVNSRVRLIFTVPPVPLIATYEDRHVLVSTTASKSILRAAIDEVAAADPGVDYFPSYEIVTGQYARGRYFAPDLRSVTDEGVGHVMRLFIKHFTQGLPVGLEQLTPIASDAHLDKILTEQRQLKDVVCDEEAIDVKAP
jgi:hypothetical protein